ncbi:restriction endonuclease PLD domain-containing protein [Staphylococcus equorum]|uniref:restriction endonuclease PLD domain-containing protein n=1 Tax=Staphylococcus equorum TaxID=246432 RepID=UPI000D1CD77D|nr:restriction endonuclease PLD domain-containing protein [Staphylococcus equorum]PTE31462.1 NgoFVII family restriction endonuclease [Staphylococcus equorum]RIM06773.1 NgoFVII family restriction endonuclease [Staphylococcus equorum]
MLYYTGLEEVIFSKHEILPYEPDELIIISGYLGPSPIERLKDLTNIEITVIGGMYINGIDMRLLNSLEKINNQNSKLKILYSNKEIHSKIYIWKKKGETLAALIGSANFSSNGLRTDYRESLADATRDTFVELDRYYQFILKNSSKDIKINQKKKEIKMEPQKQVADELDINNVSFTAEVPLYDEKKNRVASYSGLNWGRARFNNAHTAEGDAYIRIPKKVIEENVGLIKPLDPNFITLGGKRKRNSDPIEIIWDDGFVMEASLEGEQKLNGVEYPKQLASYSLKKPFFNGKKISSKSILGRYLRKRLKIGIDVEITKEILDEYGRNSITLSLISEGVYYADFSNNK